VPVLFLNLLPPAGISENELDHARELVTFSEVISRIDRVESDRNALRTAEFFPGKAQSELLDGGDVKKSSFWSTRKTEPSGAVLQVYRLRGQCVKRGEKCRKPENRGNLRRLIWKEG
jgi:hypothetical protein